MKILTVKTIDNKQMKRLLTVEANGKRKRNFWRLSLHEFNRYVETAPRETTLSKKKKKLPLKCELLISLGNLIAQAAILAMKNNGLGP